MVAAIVAAITGRQQDEEEKRMTSYSQQDLSQNWEFNPALNQRISQPRGIAQGAAGRKPCWLDTS
jgi:hypothetical protein